MNKNDTPTVSIILPIYNVELYLAECLDSVLKQTFNNYELIAVNDGSTDKSMQVLYSYKDRFAEKLIIVEQENQGLSAARNVGIKNAHGNFVYFLDSDDWILPKTLEKCAEALTNNNSDLVVFNAKAFCDDMPEDMVKKYAYTRNLPSGSYDNGHILFVDSRTKGDYIVQSCCYMYRLSAFKSLRFIDGIIHEDNYFTTMLFINSSNTTVLLERFFQRRIRNNSITTGKIAIRNATGYYETVEALNRDLPRNEISRKEVSHYLDYMVREALAIEQKLHGNNMKFGRKLELLKKISGAVSTKVLFRIVMPRSYLKLLSILR